MSECPRIRFHYFNLVDQDATDIAASTENANYPVSNLKTYFTSDTFRTTASSGSVVFDFKTVEPVNSIIIKASPYGFGFNGDLTIEANATSNFAAPAFSTTLTPNRELGLGVLYLDIAQNYRFWRVSGSGSLYFELANIFIGSYLIPGKNIIYDWTFDDNDLSKSSSNLYGQRFIDKIGYQKKINAQIKLLETAEMEALNEFFYYVGINKPFYAIVDPGELFSTNMEYFGSQYFLTDKPVFTNIAFGYYNTGIGLIECI